MSKHWLLTFAGVTLSAMLVLTVSDAFAENPTPFDEWDFDFTLVDVNMFQDPTDLQRLVIKPQIFFAGDMPMGTVNIYADITAPDGSESTTFGTLKDMKRDDIGTVRLVHGIAQEGIYTINLRITPPSAPFLDHVFDSKTITYEVEKHGFEKPVAVIGTENDEMITYEPENPLAIKYFESVHVVVNLPEVHTFEKIQVTNGDFVKDFDINTEDIYLTSRQGYHDLQVNLVKENNLIPMADAQDTLQDYVQFYKVNKDLCGSLSCVAIDNKIPTTEIIPMWVLISAVVGVGIVAFVYVMTKKTNKQKTDDPETDDTGYLTKIKTNY